MYDFQFFFLLIQFKTDEGVPYLKKAKKVCVMKTNYKKDDPDSDPLLLVGICGSGSGPVPKRYGSGPLVLLFDTNFLKDGKGRYTK
jgi:hypothetical protein